MAPLYDAHNHLAGAALAPHRAQILADLAAAGVAGAVVNGTDESEWPAVAALARAHSLVRPSYGLHPWDVGNRSPAWLESLRAFLAADPNAAVGEIGLDRWMLDRARPDDPRLAGLRRAPLDEQLEVFNAQLAFAAELARPVTIHCIDAFGLLLETLQSAHAAHRLPARGFLLHAYSGSAEMIAPFAELGAYFSFNGAYLAPRHARLREVYQLVPPDRLLVETDAPAMLAPAAHAPFALPPAAENFPLNHPANVAAAYAALATLRRLPPEILAANIGENFRRLFG
jgi:TatD DNase family protein